MRGAFIVIEGLDRSGKSTQSALLADKLSSNRTKPVKLIKFPDRTTKIGEMIDSYLRSHSELDDHAIHLLFSANRWELASTIENLLKEGTTIVCDRYAFSGIAFTFAKSFLNSKASLTYEWSRSPDAGLPAPDVTLFLDISPDAAKSRGGYGDERYEKEEMQRHVRGVFQTIGKDVAETGGRWVELDAGRDVHSVAADIWNIIQEYERGVDGPVKTLWSNQCRV